MVFFKQLEGSECLVRDQTDKSEAAFPLIPLSSPSHLLRLRIVLQRVRARRWPLWACPLLRLSEHVSEPVKGKSVDKCIMRRKSLRASMETTPWLVKPIARDQGRSLEAKSFGSGLNYFRHKVRYPLLVTVLEKLRYLTSLPRATRLLCTRVIVTCGGAL